MRAVEVGVVGVENGVVTREFEKLINPCCAIDRYSMAVHGITDSQVAGAPKFREIWDEMASLLDGAIVAAHNASFDATILRNELKLMFVVPPQMEWWCTLKLSRKVYSKMFDSYSLHNLQTSLRLKSNASHRALDDALAAYRLFEAIVEEFDKNADLYDEMRNVGRIKNNRVWPWLDAA